MKPIKFEEATKVLGKPEGMKEKCNDLWVYNDGIESISCWKMSWKDRIKALLYGKVWLGVRFGQSQPPVWVDCNKTVFIKQEEE